MGLSKNLNVGALEAIAKDTVYQADSALIITCYTTGSYMGIYADASNPPTTLVANDSSTASIVSGSCAIIAAGEYYKLVTIGSSTGFFRRKLL